MTAGNGSSISDRARTSASADDQIEFNEKQIDNADLAALLDERGVLNEARLKAIRDFEEKDRQAKARISEYELAVGEVMRAAPLSTLRHPTSGIRRGRHCRCRRACSLAAVP